MTNINYMINLLLDISERCYEYEDGERFERISIDDGGASEEAMVHYHIAWPYFVGDGEALCHENDDAISRDICAECKCNWLLREVDK